MISSEYLGKWLAEEHVWADGKFPHAGEVTKVRNGHATFSSQVSSYWDRLQSVRMSEEFVMPETRADLLPIAAQYAAKTITVVTALWSTIKTMDKDGFGGVKTMPIRDIVASTTEQDAIKAYSVLDVRAVDDTDLGRGVGFYADRLRRRGVPDTNLGKAAELIHVREIYMDAAALALAQFNECYEGTGTLPLGGTSSGNVNVYHPEI